MDRLDDLGVAVGSGSFLSTISNGGRISLILCVAECADPDWEFRRRCDGEGPQRTGAIGIRLIEARRCLGDEKASTEDGVPGEFMLPFPQFLC